MLYSKLTGGFYDRDIHNVVPQDTVEVDTALYNSLMEGQSLGTHIIIGDDAGYPVLTPIPPLSPLELATEIRRQRNVSLAESDWTQFRDIPVETGTLWAPYRQELRDIPAQPGFPTNVIWPVAPV